MCVHPCPVLHCGLNPGHQATFSLLPDTHHPCPLALTSCHHHDVRPPLPSAALQAASRSARPPSACSSQATARCSRQQAAWKSRCAGWPSSHPASCPAHCQWGGATSHSSYLPTRVTAGRMLFWQRLQGQIGAAFSRQACVLLPAGCFPLPPGCSIASAKGWPQAQLALPALCLRSPRAAVAGSCCAAACCPWLLSCLAPWLPCLQLGDTSKQTIAMHAPPHLPSPSHRARA